MLRLRDALAHGKSATLITDVVLKRKPRDADQWPEPEWKQLSSLPSVRRMVEYAEAIVRDLNKQSGSSRDPFASPGHGSADVSPLEEKQHVVEQGHAVVERRPARRIGVCC